MSGSNESPKVPLLTVLKRPSAESGSNLSAYDFIDATDPTWESFDSSDEFSQSERGRDLAAMKIPHTIRQSTREQYVPSEEAKALVSEQGRNVLAEDLEWDQGLVPTLAELALLTIIKNFEQRPILKELPCEAYATVIGMLPTTLPLAITVPLIEEEVFWKRAYKEEFGTLLEVPHPGSTWKCIYLERHICAQLEVAECEYQDEEDMDELLILCSPYIHRLKLTQLRVWEIPRTWDEDEYPVKKYVDHISLVPVLKHLHEVEEVDIVFGERIVADNYEFRLFELSVKDCQNVGKALLLPKKLQTVRIHRSFLDCKHVQALCQQLIRNTTIVELDLSHCRMRDEGTKCLAYMMLPNSTLEVLNVTNNKIGPEGCQALAFVMNREECKLRTLILRLNPIQDRGARLILSSLVRKSHLENLSLAACGLPPPVSECISAMLEHNETLHTLDISSNKFGEEAGEAMVQGLAQNETLVKIDIVNCLFSPLDQQKIMKKVRRNYLISIGETPPEEPQDIEVGEGQEEEASENDDEAQDLFQMFMSLKKLPEKGPRGVALGGGEAEGEGEGEGGGEAEGDGEGGEGAAEDAERVAEEEDVDLGELLLEEGE